MIHGHMFIKGVPTTKNYFPCGDLREVFEIESLFKQGHTTINLKNHGFLIASNNLHEMDMIVNSIQHS